MTDIKLTKRNQKRIQSKIKKQKIEQALRLDTLPQAHLKSLHGSLHTDVSDVIPIAFDDYLELVESTGRCMRDDKRGFIPDTSKKIIHALGLNPEHGLLTLKISVRYMQQMLVL